MLKVTPFLDHKSMLISTHYPVMVIGGAEDKVNGCGILTAFFKSAGGKMATIGIIPCASQEPSVVGDRYYQIFKGMGAQQVQILDIRQPKECDQDRWLDILANCTGVFVTGGDQLRLRDLIGGSRFMTSIKERIAQGELVLAGTSAGAAIVGERMIAGGSSGESPNQSLVDLTTGLGIFPELLVDQHFHNRNRMARLISAIAAHPDKLGIGIDEDTCAAFENDGTFEVLGQGTITIVDPGKLTHTNYRAATQSSPLSLHNLTVHVLSPGDRYDYQNRVVLS
ncbi:cyanophycinase [Chamaesiphon minutus]|uniref:Cyanophycinase n=1 Tax=Chamaesiphon minutus (strain ATCC 27169 / PCC 6605) TaxID=1173020 RepID=K9ULY7_CHAP6|nr:cyanophycinase [Chamaesiphon minutus PCC 6605]